LDRSKDPIIGYYKGENVIKPIFEKISLEEFRKKYHRKKPVMGSHLAEDTDKE